MKQFRGYLNYSSLIEWNTKTEVYDTCYRKMNASERIAYKFLLDQGYKETEISFNFSRSPDFITSDGKLWEVKTEIGDKILFTTHQCRMKPETIILLVSKSGFITQHLFKNIVNNVNVRFIIGYCGKTGLFQDAVKEMDRRDLNRESQISS